MIIKKSLKKIKKENYVINNYKKIKKETNKKYKKYVIDAFIQKKGKKWNIIEEKIKIEVIVYNNSLVKIISIKKINSKDIHKYRPYDTDHQSLKNNIREIITKHHYKTKEDLYKNIPKCKLSNTRSIICNKVKLPKNKNINKKKLKMPANYGNISNNNLIQDKEYKNGMNCSLMYIEPIDIRSNRQSIPLRCHSLYNSKYNKNECI